MSAAASKRGPQEDSDSLGLRVAFVTVLVLVLLGAAAYLALYFVKGDHTPRGARVEGVAIGGLTPAAAEDKLRAALEPRASQPIEITFGDDRGASLTGAKIGLTVDYAGSVREAGGGSSLRPGHIWAALVGGGDHTAVLKVDDALLDEAMDDLSRQVGRGPVEGTVEFRDGKAVPVDSKAGVVVVRGAAEALLKRQFLHGGSAKLPVRTQDASITDEAVKTALAEFGEPAMSGPVILEIEGQKVSAPPKLFGQGLSMVPSDGRLVPAVDGPKIVKALAPVMDTTGAKPVDAKIVIRKGKPVVVPSTAAVRLDAAELEKGFADVVVKPAGQRVLAVKGRAAQPAFTTEDAKALKIVERVSTFTTHFPYAAYRNVNLTRAAELINGTIVKPGETFSLNGIVGERTRENGFTEGYVISDGLFKKDLGGGVSQIATTTFNAMFFAGLQDVQHKPHSVYIDRYPVGREATVAWPTLDLKFKNDTEYGVLVTASVRKATGGSQGAATVSMWSTKKWDITASAGPRTNYRAPQVRYLQGPTCETASGTSGFSIDVFRYFHPVGSKEVLRKEKFHTDYIPGDTVRCGEPPKPKPTDPAKPGKPGKPAKPGVPAGD